MLSNESNNSLSDFVSEFSPAFIVYFLERAELKLGFFFNSVGTEKKT